MARCSFRLNRAAVLTLVCAVLLCAFAGCASARRAGPAAVQGSAEGSAKSPPASAGGTVPPPAADAGAGQTANGGGSQGAGDSAVTGEPAGAETAGGDGTPAAPPINRPPEMGAGSVFGSVGMAPPAGDRPGADRPESATGGGATTSGTAAPAPSDPGRGAAAGGLLLRLSASPAVPRVGDRVTVEVRASTLARVVDAPLHLDYDATRLRYVAGEEGDFLKRDGTGTVFLINGLSLPGVVTIGLGRLDRAHGLSGSGTHCRVRFEVIAPGASRVAVGQAMAWADDGSMLEVETGAVEVSVPEP